MPKDNSSTDEEIYCDICFASLARRADLPRHMKTHSKHKDKLMFRCPYPSCNYANLQKCNVDTHIRIHTGNKNQVCPDCEFKTVDPGSLTRHRKRAHGYVPKARRPRLGGANSKKSTRTAPYPPNSRRSPAASQSSSPSATSSSSWCTTSDDATSPPSSQDDASTEASSPSQSSSSETQVNMVLVKDSPTSTDVWSSLFPTSPFDTYDKLKLEAQTTPLDATQSPFTFPWAKNSGGDATTQPTPFDSSSLLNFSNSLWSLLPAADAPFGIQGPSTWGDHPWLQNFDAPVALSAPNQCQLGAIAEPILPMLPPVLSPSFSSALTTGLQLPSAPIAPLLQCPSIPPAADSFATCNFGIDWDFLRGYINAPSVTPPSAAQFPPVCTNSSALPSSLLDVPPFEVKPSLNAHASSNT